MGGKSYVISLFDTAGQPDTSNFRAWLLYHCDHLLDSQIYPENLISRLLRLAWKEEYIHLRALSYVNSDVFLLCFSVAMPESLRDAQDKWIPEIQQYSPNTPIILVGTQIDLRDEVPQKSRSNSTRDSHKATKAAPSFISTKEGSYIAMKLDLDCYIECSSLTETGVTRLREATIESGLRKVNPDDNGCHCACVIL